LIFEQSTYSEYKYVDPEQFEENVDKSKWREDGNEEDKI
jgi:hypothetical protein